MDISFSEKTDGSDGFSVSVGDDIQFIEVTFSSFAESATFSLENLCDVADGVYEVTHIDGVIDFKKIEECSPGMRKTLIVDREEVEFMLVKEYVDAVDIQAIHPHTEKFPKTYLIPKSIWRSKEPLASEIKLVLDLR
jgi:hypothetical protein